MKMTKWMLALPVFVGLTLAATAGQAQQSGYGMAGCGLGSLLFGNKPGFVQVFAATTNGTFGSQTFGITSGTSNCTDTAGGVKTARAFVEANREALAKDAARGQGETIKGLASIAGCGSDVKVGAALQAEFGKIFPAASVSDTAVSSKVVDVLKARADLSCKKLS